MAVSQWLNLHSDSYFCRKRTTDIKWNSVALVLILLTDSCFSLPTVKPIVHPPPLPGKPYTGPLITSPRPPPPSKLFPSTSTFTESYTKPSSRTTPHPPAIIDESVSGHDGSPGSIGLLYVFSEASKRLPIAELPMHMDYMGQSINNWAGNTVKGIGSQATSFGDTLVEYLSSAAGEAIKRSGELLTSSINSLERTVKEYLSDWIGCRPLKG